ncbi:MAG: cyclic nucleotide-binding domain-containing protein [Planctomycetes bacterium]|nr:cyclic nucleotide-binding domain-containing protein [Planctomycetota bacterium]
MEATFKFLTAQDQELLLSDARRVHYPRDEEILAEGSRRQAIFLVRKGMVRIERAYLGRGVSVARLGPGTLFGEMSFVEDSGASASVIADEEVEADVMEGAAIHARLSADPALALRFYQSLALTLSQRLRETSARLLPLMIHEIAQVRLFHAQRTGHLNPDQIPAELEHAVEDFKTALLEADRGLRDNKLGEEEGQERVSQVCHAVLESLFQHTLEERHLEKGLGAYVFRETFPFFMRSAFIDRAYTKPRGYAGDYETIEKIYANQPAGDGRLGPSIDRWALGLPFAQSIRNRREYLRGAIDAALAGWPHRRPMPVASLGCGPAREIFDLFKAAVPPNVLATGVDIDNEALVYAAARAKERRLSARVTFAQENIVNLCRGRGSVQIAPQQILYCIGLTDYLSDSHIVALLNWIHEHLLPGGMVILGNFDVSNPDKPFLDHILEWELFHRSTYQIRNLFSQSRFGQAAVEVKTESTGIHLFASSTRA